MTEKVKLTREQVAFIKAYEKNVASYNGWEEDLLYQHAEQWGKSFKDAKPESQCMRTISPMNMAKILLFGYEVEEEEFVVGELVKYWHELDKKWVFGQFVKSSKGLVWAYWGDDTVVRWMATDKVSKSNQEEIETEKERMKWVELGREVGELRDGDIGVRSNGVFVLSKEIFEIRYRNGDIKGFYPAESFISLNK